MIIRFFLLKFGFILLASVIVSSSQLGASENFNCLTDHLNFMLKNTPALDPAKGEIHFKVYGEEHPETLVLVHGLDSSGDTFASVIDDLSKKYRILVYDQRGHGQTLARGNDYSTRVMANDLRSLMDYLGIRNAHLLGHSMGGRTVARFAQLFPERVRTVTIEDMELIARTKNDLTEFRKVNEEADQLDQKFRQVKFSSHNAIADALKPYFGEVMAKSLVERKSVRNADGTVALSINPGVSYRYRYQSNIEDLGQVLASSNKPVLFLQSDPNHGSSMSEAGVEAIRSEVPGATVVLVPDSGHSIHRTHPKEVIQLLTSFVDKHKGS